MTEIFSGKIIEENEKYVIVETPLNLDDEVLKSIYAIPKDRIIEVDGVPEQFWENFVCVGNEVKVLRTDDFEFKLKFYLEGEAKR
ncbi:MAG: hypothetical protein QXL57_02390 [Candidatus Bathyarchaeia archaeon]